MTSAASPQNLKNDCGAADLGYRAYSDLNSKSTSDVVALAIAPHLSFGLDEPLPDQIVVGKGEILPLKGWCYSVSGPLQTLDVIAGSTVTAVPNHSWGRTDIFMEQCPALDPSGNSLLSGFHAFIPFAPVTADTDVTLSLRATLKGGDVVKQAIGTVRLRPSYGADPATVTWPSTGPRVAICMAMFRPPPALFLAQVASIQAQTHTNWVCIISDDNTEQKDYDPIRALLNGDGRFLFFQNQSRLNFYDNFQQALCRAPVDADFIALCDQDDVWHPNKLETLLGAFKEGTQLAYSDARLVGQDGQVLSDTFWVGRQNNYSDLSTLLVANTITGAASMIRASLLPDVLPFPRQVGPAFHDHWIGLVAMVRGGVAYVDTPLYDYVQHGTGVIGHNFRRWPGVVAAMVHVVQAGPNYRDMLLTMNLTLKQAVNDYQFVQQKIALARMLLLRNPDMSAQHRKILQRFARFETSMRAALAERIAALRAKRSTLNLEGLLLWSMLGVRLRNYGLKAKQGSITRQQIHNHEVRAVEAAAMAADPAALPVLAGPQKPHEFYPGNIPVLEFGTTKWIHRNILPFTLDISDTHPKRVNVLLATINFSYVFGGYIGMFNLALRLVREGYRVRIILLENTEWNMEDWRRQIQKYPGLTTLFDEVEVMLRWDRAIPIETNPADRFVATNCWSAHVAHHSAKLLEEKRFLFMAQEYEPFFMAMNSISALFQQAYTLPQLTLYSTELLQDYFRRERIGVFAKPDGEANALVFSNAIQKFYPTREQITRPQRRFLFYARWEEHAARNLFELALMAIAKLVKDPRVDLTGWSFHGIGSLGGNTLELAEGLPLELVPKTTLDEYIKLMPNFDVGLSLMMTPHPSLVPIEMASAGMWTVTNTFANKTAEKLRSISTNLIGVLPTVDAICEGLVDAMARVDQVDERLAGAKVNWPTDWDHAFPDDSMNRVRAFLGEP